MGSNLSDDDLSRLLGVTRNPNQEAPHRLHARAWREAGYNHMAEASRVTGIHERTLQSYMGYQSSTESPTERTERLIRALRQTPSEDPDRPLRVLAESLGYVLVRAEEGAHRAGMLGATVDALSHLTGLVDSARQTIDPSSAGGENITVAEVEDLYRVAQEARESIRRLVRTAEAASNVHPISKSV